MPKLNKCIHRKKSNEMIGKRGKSFHFGYHIVFRCDLDNSKCIGMNECEEYDEKKDGN